MVTRARGNAHTYELELNDTSNDGPPAYEEVIGLPTPIETIIEPFHPVQNPICPEHHNSLRCYMVIACILIISLAAAITCIVIFVKKQNIAETSTTVITMTGIESYVIIKNNFIEYNVIFHTA